jgi:hypothetical protein
MKDGHGSESTESESVRKRQIDVAANLKLFDTPPRCNSKKLIEYQSSMHGNNTKLMVDSKNSKRSSAKLKMSRFHAA